MKKILPFLFCLTSLPAFAVKITADTPLQWNAVVVITAAQETLYKNMERSTADYIVSELLSQDSFSIGQAAVTCKSIFQKEHRNLYTYNSDMINLARWCEDFAFQLIAINNQGINSIHLGDGEYDARGRIYTEDGLFYVDQSEPVSVEYIYHNEDLVDRYVGSCHTAVFESATNRRIATCTKIDSDGWGSEAVYEGIKPDYTGYQFVESCNYNILSDYSETTCSLGYNSESAYRDFYLKRYKPCAEGLGMVNFNTVKRIIDSSVFPHNITSKLEQIYEARFFVRNNSANETTPELYDELYDAYEEYCSGLETVGFGFNLSEFIQDLQKDIDDITAFFSDITKYKNTEVESLEQARGLIDGDLRKVTRYYNGGLNCWGDCNQLPGSQDWVKCELGNLKTTFEFDDICD